MSGYLAEISLERMLMKKSCHRAALQTQTATNCAFCVALHNGIFAHFETTGPVAGRSLGVHLRPISSFHLIESYRCGHVSLLPAALTRSSLFRPLDCLFSGGRGPGRAVAKGNIATGQFMCRKSRENWQWPFVFFFWSRGSASFFGCLSLSKRRDNFLEYFLVAAG